MYNLGLLIFLLSFQLLLLVHAEVCWLIIKQLLSEVILEISLPLEELRGRLRLAFYKRVDREPVGIAAFILTLTIEKSIC